MNTSSNPDCSNLFYAHLLALRTRSIPRSKSSVNSDFLNSPNLNLSKRIIPIFHSISIYIIKSNITRIYRQDNRKRFIAVNINHLNCVAIIYFKLLYLLLIHRNKCSLIISLYGVLGNSSLNPERVRLHKKLSEGKSWTIEEEREQMKGTSHKDVVSNLSIKKRDVDGMHVILFDDVLTSGQSFIQLKRRMIDVGAKSVTGIFLGKTVLLND